MSSEVVLTASRAQSAILEHQIKTAIEVLHAFDLSETGLSRYLAKRVEAARHKISDMAENQPRIITETTKTGLNDPSRGKEMSAADQGPGGDQFNFEAFFQDQTGHELSRLLDPSISQGMVEGFNGVGWGESNTLLFPPTGGNSADYATSPDWER